MTIVPDMLITTYLEMTRPDQFRPSYLQRSDILILPLLSVDIDYYRFLYKGVGEPWRWRDRLIMADAELSSVLASDSNSVYVLYVGGTPAGYVELQQQQNDVEIAYFGLRMAYLGQGLGKHLLSYGISEAWTGGAKRVWVHTCNLDGPYALKNYKSRGFSVYKITEEQMPERYL